MTPSKVVGDLQRLVIKSLNHLVCVLTNVYTCMDGNLVNMFFSHVSFSKENSDTAPKNTQ